MDGDQIDDVARDAPVGRCRRFVGGKIDRVEHVAEQIIGLGRKKTKSGIRHPFELHRFTVARNGRFALAFAYSARRKLVPRRRESCLVGLGGGLQALFGIVEDIDVGGEAGASTVNRNAAGNVAVGAALGRGAVNIQV